MPHKRKPEAKERRRETRTRVTLDTALREKVSLPSRKLVEGYPIPLIEALANVHCKAEKNDDARANAFVR